MFGLAHLVSLTIYIELEGRMIPQNDTLGEAVDPRPKFFSGLPEPSGLPENSDF